MASAYAQGGVQAAAEALKQNADELNNNVAGRNPIDLSKESLQQPATPGFSGEVKSQFGNGFNTPHDPTNG